MGGSRARLLPPVPPRAMADRSRLDSLVRRTVGGKGRLGGCMHSREVALEEQVWGCPEVVTYSEFPRISRMLQGWRLAKHLEMFAVVPVDQTGV